MLKRFVVAGVLAAGLSTYAHALEFQALGSGALGVGGAGVARASSAMAPYWNPAGLAFAEKSVSVSIVGGAGLQPGKKLAEHLDTLSNAFDAWDANQTDSTTQNNLATAINAFSDSDNLRATANAAVGIQIKHFGTGVFSTFEGGAYPRVTPITLSGNAVNDATALNASLNASNVYPRGILLAEVPVSYGYDLDLKDFGHLGLGITGKYLYGSTTSAVQPLYENGEILQSSDLTDKLSKNRNTEGSWGIDLGALWKTGKFLPIPASVGIVAKNLNSPSFTAKNNDKFNVDPQVRAGICVSPLTWLDLAADIDVTRNSTVVPGLKSQLFGGGAEFKPFSSLKLRLGGYTDFAQSTGAVTAGLSFGIPSVFIDIDGAYGLGKVSYDNNSYPTEARAQFSMNFAF